MKNADELAAVIINSETDRAFERGQGEAQQNGAPR